MFIDMLLPGNVIFEGENKFCVCVCICVLACTWPFKIPFFLTMNCNEIMELLISFTTHLFNAFELIEFYVANYVQ